MGDKSVIIADDDQLVRLTLRMAMERRGFVVADVADGAQLLAQIQASTFDLCIMDASMPGPSLVERVAAIRRTAPMTGVLIVSGYPEPPGDIVDNNGVRFMQKPIDLGALYGVLDAFEAAGSSGGEG